MSESGEESRSGSSEQPDGKWQEKFAMKLRFPQRAVGIAVRLIAIAGSLVALVLAIAWLSGMFEEKIEPNWSDRGVRQLTTEPTDVVQEVQRAFTEEAVGTLKASSRTAVSSKLLAAIRTISVTAGDEVTAGQEIVRLDDQEFLTRLDQAKQALAATVARRSEAEKQYARLRELVNQNVVSRTEYDRVSRDLQVAQAEELQAQQAVSEAEVMLSYTTILAPKSGRIVDRLAEPGDMARPGEPLLVLYDATSLRLEAPVMEHRALELNPGDQLQVYVDALQKEFLATVDEIVPQADALSRSFLVKASLPRSDDLYEGLFGRLRIPAGNRRHLCLATDAVVKIGQLEFVDVVLPDKTIERRLIKSGQLGMPGHQEVLSGLEAGDQVILYGNGDQPASSAHSPTSSSASDSNNTTPLSEQSLSTEGNSSDR
jgi:RND family efflux transporter MFP subunit